MAGTTSNKNVNPGSVQSTGSNFGVQLSKCASLWELNSNWDTIGQMFFQIIKLKTPDNQASTVTPE